MTKPSTVEHIYDEPGLEPWPARRHSPHRPRLSYKACMASYLVTQDGVIRTVKECSTQEFSELVEVCTPMAKDSDACKRDLKGFTYKDSFEKWWALLLLAEQKCSLPIYADRVAAEENRGKQRKK
jgi:hypothetical protein